MHVLAPLEPSLYIRGQLLATAISQGAGVPRHLPLSFPEHLVRAALVGQQATPHEALALILTSLGRLEAVGDITLLTAETMRFQVSRYIDYVGDGLHLPSLSSVNSSDAEGFASARSAGRDGTLDSPSVSTQHLRRTAVRVCHRLGRQLGLCDNDPTLDLVLPSRSGRVTRPLTEDEAVLGRAVAAGATRPAICAWALAECGGTPGEIATVSWDDIDFADATVSFRGNAQTLQRSVPLTSWSFDELRRAHMSMVELRPVYNGTSGRSGQSYTSSLISQVLKRSGLSAEPDVSPSSVRALAGYRALRAGGIERAAYLLGTSSLDRAATIVGWDWRAEAGDDR